jgi:hypothetical protein
MAFKSSKELKPLCDHHHPVPLSIILQKCSSCAVALAAGTISEKSPARCTFSAVSGQKSEMSFWRKYGDGNCMPRTLQYPTLIRTCSCNKHVSYGYRSVWQEPIRFTMFVFKPCLARASNVRRDKHDTANCNLVMKYRCRSRNKSSEILSDLRGRLSWKEGGYSKLVIIDWK